LKKQRVKKEDRQKRIRKLAFLIVAASIVTVSGLVGWLVLSQEVSFEEAIAKPHLREDYIEKIVKKVGKPDYVREINYIDTLEEFEMLKRVLGYIPEPKTWMAILSLIEFHIEELGKRPLPVRILIFPEAFTGEILKTENDFISSLLHEYHHAQVLNQGKIDSIDFRRFIIVEGTFKGCYNLALIKEIMELAAIREEIHSPLKISSGYKIQRFHQYLEHYTNIWSHEEGMNPEFIKFLKTEFFESWMLELPYLFKELDKTEEIWYFKSLITGEKFYLPEEIIRKFS